MYYHLTLLLILFYTALPGACFWIISHPPLVAQRLDPILSETSVSSHVHTFVGSSAILATQNRNKLCTTSKVKADRSSYWAPQLYYYRASKNPRFSSVALSYVQTYYLNRGSNLKAFPQGLRVIAGNNTAISAPDPDKTKAKAVSYVCLNYKSGSTTTTTLPAGPCPDGLRTQIVFPSCWDGKNLDSADHQSHMSYPLGGFPDSGDCPSSHPVKFMTLFYEFVYSSLNLTKTKSGKSGFVLANGDSVGYAFHADFVADWDEDVLQAAIDQCTGNLFSDLKSCPPFVATLDDDATCTTKQSVKENVLGKLKHLPGCQAIKNGASAGRGVSGCKVPTLTIKAQQGGPDDATFPNRRALTGGEEISEAKSDRRSDGSAFAARRQVHRRISEELEE